MFRDGADKTSQTMPFSMFDSDDPEGLHGATWRAYEAKTGGSAIAIPHNGNTSNGLMFNDKDFNRQAHGQGICGGQNSLGADHRSHIRSRVTGRLPTPCFLRNDEFADYENWDVSNLAGDHGVPIVDEAGCCSTNTAARH